MNLIIVFDLYKNQKRSKNSNMKSNSVKMRPIFKNSHKIKLIFGFKDFI